MKSIKLLLIGLAAAFALTGCGDSSKDTPEPEGDGNVVGSWHLVSWSSLQSADVYLSFSESGSFDIYQRLLSTLRRTARIPTTNPRSAAGTATTPRGEAPRTGFRSTRTEHG